MVKEIKSQNKMYLAVYVIFGLIGTVLMFYYLSNTIVHFTTGQQFPINSFLRFPLSFLIFPAEVFSFFFSMYFVYNLIHGNKPEPMPAPTLDILRSPVAILIPVYHEPVHIVRRTLQACRKVVWSGGVHTYLLIDSTNPENKRDMEKLAREHGARIVTRVERTGYKAGNVNNAVKNAVTEKYFAILDSDQAPEPEFLKETMGHFADPTVAFVQTPQHFINGGTLIERAQKLGTNVFYQAQCVSKAKDHSMPFCGTNAVVRTDVFRLVNGFAYYTATEDIELGFRMNEAGFHGAYVPKALVKGYATVDFSAYTVQQYRWANGNMAILRQAWSRVLLGKFSMRQQIHMIFTSGWWLVGIVSLLYICVPILSFILGGTHHTWLATWMLGLLFFNVVLGILMIYFALGNRDDNDKVTLSDAFLQYSLMTNSMFIYGKAAINVLFKRYVSFVRTNKEGQATGYREISWNLGLAFICFCVSIFALYKTATAGSIEQLRTYLPVSAWMLLYTIVLASSLLFVGKLPGASNVTVASSKVAPK